MAADNCDILDKPTRWNGYMRLHAHDESRCYAPQGRIIQIVPAPSGMMAYVDNGDAFPVLCLALLEDCAGNRYVEGLINGDWATLEQCSVISNFVRYGQ